MFPERSGHRIYPSVRVRPVHSDVIINGAVMLSEALQRNAKHEARSFKHLWRLAIELHSEQ